MALLLAMYQKMRLIREINQDTLKLARISSKKQSVQKNITRVQKHFTSLLAQLDSQAKMMQNNASIFFRNSMGLGVNSVNPYDYASASSTNMFIQQRALEYVRNGVPFSVKSDGENKTVNYTLAEDKFFTMLEKGGPNGLTPIKDDDGNPVKEPQTYFGTEGKEFAINDEKITAEEAQIYQKAMQMAQMDLSKAQTMVSQATNTYASNVSIWLEAQKAQLEAQQDAQLEPLSYEDTMIDLEKSQLETRLEMLKAEKQSYDQLVSAEAKEAAPKFGV